MTDDQAHGNQTQTDDRQALHDGDRHQSAGQADAGQRRHTVTSSEPATSVTRSVDLDAAADEVWELVADPERRGSWLDDEDAASRTMRIDHVDEGRSLTWTWWHPDDDASASQVHVELTELTDGATRVAVTERLLSAPTMTMQAHATVATAARLWDNRILGLELLVVAAGALVG